MANLGEVLDPVRKQVIDVKDALAHTRYRYSALDLLLENISDSKLRAASQEIFAVASEKMNAVDDMLHEFYQRLSAVDRMLQIYDASERRREAARD
ncbi:hypothetical protein [Chelativorans sp. AA-79]|uniref:hypothetical protein n=1 Tax=Chelativorans sp. AA-79 TaxID=3028735 RepID=UPI0023FA06B8|nr:hypothetical protein [Chelativorans sp. AA-79]WEX10758.1 hypothetical protein PVE73_07420 [Chelativorans sp. AA-79]